jgi:hypothetical protein
MMKSIDFNLEPNAPDWSKERASDQMMAETLRRQLDVPFWKRSPSDWRMRAKKKKLLKKLNELGFKA